MDVASQRVIAIRLRLMLERAVEVDHELSSGFRQASAVSVSRTNGESRRADMKSMIFVSGHANSVCVLMAW